MPGNDSIQILRGTSSGIQNHNAEILNDGQLLYNKTTNSIVVGDGETTIENLTPIVSSAATEDGAGNVITSTYATKTELGAETTARQQGDTANSTSITNIINGTTVVGKATSDGSGNNIVNTYATKTQLSEETSARTTAYNQLNTNITNIVNGTTTVGNATNVTTNINGNAIASIFESDGVTAKNATNATTASNYNQSSGTILNKFNEIDERLTSLGFKSGSVELADDIIAAENWLCKIGTQVIGRLLFMYNKTSVSSKQSLPVGTIPSDFRPTWTGTCDLNCGNYWNQPNDTPLTSIPTHEVINKNYKSDNVELDALTGEITVDYTYSISAGYTINWLCIYIAYDINSKNVCKMGTAQEVTTCTLTKVAGRGSKFSAIIPLNNTDRATLVVLENIHDYVGTLTGLSTSAKDFAGTNSPVSLLTEWFTNIQGIDALAVTVTGQITDGGILFSGTCYDPRTSDPLTQWGGNIDFTIYQLA